MIIEKVYEISRDNVFFDGNYYPIVGIDYDDDGYMTIGSESLEDALFPDDEEVSREAKIIDEDILFYIPDEKLKMDDEKLIDYLRDVIDWE